MPVSSGLLMSTLRPGRSTPLKEAVNKRGEKGVELHRTRVGRGGLALTVKPDWSWHSTAEGASP